MFVPGHEEIQWCSGSLMFVYVVPSLLFIFAYLVTCVVLRFGETEHLQTLLERVRIGLFVMFSDHGWTLSVLLCWKEYPVISLKLLSFTIDKEYCMLSLSAGSKVYLQVYLFTCISCI